MMNRDPNKARSMNSRKQVGTEDLPDRFPEPLREDYRFGARDRAGFEGMLASVRALDELGISAKLILANHPVEQFNSVAELLRVVLPNEETRRERVAAGVRFHSATLEALRTGAVLVTEVDPEPVVLLAYTMGVTADQFSALVRRELGVGGALGPDEEILQLFQRFWPGAM